MTRSPTAAGEEHRLPTLPIRTYNRLEMAARRRATYPAIRCFAPVSFAAAGFPVRVSHEHELRRYADIMWEVADRRYWLEQQQWSSDEQSLILRLQAEVFALSGILFEKPVTPFMALFPPMPIVRLIEAVADRLGRRLTVCEVGPGSGVLGAYCLLRGHQYVGIEITQALYLWQHRLFRWVADGAFRDFSEEAEPPLNRIDARASLIPWWHFARIFESPLDGIDIIVCDAAMGEMDAFAHRYLVHLAQQLLASSDAGLVLFQNLGEQRFSTDAVVAQRFAAHGFRPFTCGPVKVQVASSRGPSDLLEQLPDGAPAIGSNADLRPAVDFLQNDAAGRMESYAFFDFLRLDLG